VDPSCARVDAHDNAGCRGLPQRGPLLEVTAFLSPAGAYDLAPVAPEPLVNDLRSFSCDPGVACKLTTPPAPGLRVFACQLRGHLDQLPANVRASALDAEPDDGRGATCPGGPLVRNQVRVDGSQRDLVQWHSKVLRDDLGQYSAAALAHFG